MLGHLIRRRRDALGLSLRETARRIGISPGYLVGLEHGRNPTTGRPPTPSPPVLAAIGRVLDVDLDTLLDLAGAAPRPSAHVLLVQLGEGELPARAGARRALAGRADSWVELAEPLGLTAAGDGYDADLALRALERRMARVPPAAGERRLGLIFGAGSRPLRTVANPDALIAAEATWERDVAAACRGVVGAEPVANVCVYREADLRTVAGGDPLGVALALVRAHPHVAAQHAEGVTTGPAAIEAILGALRPEPIAPETWAPLAAAAAAGLHRRSAAA
jgi:transcriptional regulator with XRE-family HTH domain